MFNFLTTGELSAIHMNIKKRRWISFIWKENTLAFFGIKADEPFVTPVVNSSQIVVYLIYVMMHIGISGNILKIAFFFLQKAHWRRKKCTWVKFLCVCVFTIWYRISQCKNHINIIIRCLDKLQKPEYSIILCTQNRSYFGFKCPELKNHKEYEKCPLIYCLLGCSEQTRKILSRYDLI